VTIGQAGERYFLAFLGIGFDAHVSAEVSLNLKRRIGRGAYVCEALRQIFRYDFPEARFQCAAGDFPASFGVISNSRLYGGNLVMAPRASLSSPELDLCLFEKGNLLSYLRYLVQVLLRNHLHVRGVRYMKVNELQIESERPVRYQVDGEPAGFLPVCVRSRPGALILVLPRSSVAATVGRSSAAG
jgi:diacylglycerol kinase family enzyme